VRGRGPADSWQSEQKCAFRDFVNKSSGIATKS
jgi:hypothetical protein